MQESIKQVVEAEKKATEIVSSAQSRANEIIGVINSEISEKMNRFREQEIIRFNNTVSKAEKESKTSLEKIKNLEAVINVDLEAVSDETLKRVFKTVFD